MACRAALAMLKPDVVLVIGTRIIGKQTLAGINVPVVNFHSGINPNYRGQAGGYWALASGECGCDRASLNYVLGHTNSQWPVAEPVMQ